MKIVKVLIELTNSNFDEPFTYYADDDCVISPYVRVKLQFGHQQLVGLVMAIEETSLSLEEYSANLKYKLRKIGEVIDDQPLLSPELISLGKILADETFSPLISCYQAFLPPAMKLNKAKKAKIKYKKVFYPGDAMVLPKKQMECFQFIADNPGVLKEEIPFSDQILRTLIGKGAIRLVQEEDYRYHYDLKEVPEEITLNAEQAAAVATIEAEAGPFLLFGVTGSGKTEVYVRIVNQCLKENKGAIILIPEISLTPQLIKTYRNRLDEDIAVLHSKLSNGERYDEYRRLMNGEVRVVVGTRSAVFAPIKNIGAIILDEEHSSSYKQGVTPRYHAREVALIRAQYHRAKVILGSATPSLEAYAYAKAGRYKLIELKHRISNNPLPDTIIIDMNNEARSGNFRLLSNQLKEEIKVRLNKKEQVILLLNRRGFAISGFCQMCGSSFTCPNCEVDLVFHKEDDELVCHHCGYMEDAPKKCPKCSSKMIRFYRAGTQKLEQQLYEDFPTARLLRFDTDAAHYKDAHKDIVERFEKGQADILFGTQMVTKGFNFPNVTLIGAINTEDLLNRSNFRAAEETFQTLTQLIGRAGRFDKPGMAIIQSYHPQHYAIVLARYQNYPKFFATEMAIRKKRSYPPYFKTTSVVFRGPNSDDLFKWGNIAKKALSEIGEAIFSGPAFPYIRKRDNDFIVILSFRHKGLQPYVSYLKKLIKMKKEEEVRIYINNDPREDDL